MAIKEQIDAQLKNALKNGDKTTAATLRGLKSAIKYEEIEVGQDLDDNGILSVIAKQAKQRRDSIDQFEKAKRTDLVEQEAAELALLETFLPSQLSEDKIRVQAEAVIADLGVTDIKGMGLVMKNLMAKLQGQADGKVVNQIVRQLLGS